jgi:hypothetical protein
MMLEEIPDPSDPNDTGIFIFVFVFIFTSEPLCA